MLESPSPNRYGTSMPQSPPESDAPAGLNVVPLTPTYIESEHGRIVETLKAKVPVKPGTDYRVRNIAVAGPYGSGKSSVLTEFQDQLGKRAINVSLSSLTASSPELDEDADKHGFALPTTNYVQKEIVKQILYRERFDALPESRFERIHPARPTALVAVALAALVVWLGTADILRLPGAWSRIFTYGSAPAAWGMITGLGVALGALAALVYIVVRKRSQISAITAGPASITLSSRDSYYFDQYLDEIVYFFRVSKVSVVIFEDIDRFEDAHVFESLRNLNVLLNNSKELRQPIYFIYAVRDSIFADAAAKSKSRSAVDAKGSRTKFFDLIIPLVPFITHRTARDLLRKEMSEVTPPVPVEVLDLVGSEVTDMRLLRNIRNEYVAFAQMLLSGTAGRDVLPGLDPGRLFAMLVFKNLAPRQFEKIRTRSSELDDFFDALAHKKSLELQKLRARRATLLDSKADLQREAERMAPRLEALLGAVTAGAQIFQPGHSIDRIVVNSTTYQGPDVSPELLLHLSEVREASVYFTSGRSMTITSALLNSALGPRSSMEQLRANARASREGAITHVDGLYDLLRGGNLAELFRRPDIDFDGGLSVQRLADETFKKSPAIVRILLAAGAIDINYPLYTAIYYGESLAVSGMTFIVQNVEPNIPDFDYHFGSTEEIEAVLKDQGDGLFHDEASFNLEIAAHVELYRPDALRHLAVRLSRADEPARAFLSTLLRSDVGQGVWRAVAAKWQGSVHFASQMDGLTHQRRAEVFAIALEEVGEDPVDSTSDERQSGADWLDEVRTALDRSFEDLDHAFQLASTKRAANIARFLAEVGWEHPDLSRVSPAMRSQLILEDTFKLNARNLRWLAHLADDAFPSLDELADADTGAYESACRRIDDYIEALHAAGGWSIASSDAIVRVIDDVAREANQAAAVVLKSAKPELRVDFLESAPQDYWTLLISEARVTNTTVNSIAYLSKFGPIADSALEANWTAQGVFTDGPVDEPAESLAAAVANAESVPSETRVLLIGSLGEGVTISSNLLQAGARAALGELVNVGVVPDDAATLIRAVELGVDAFVGVIADSRSFADNVRALAPPPDEMILAGLRGPRTPAENKAALIDMVPAWGASRRVVDAAVNATTGAHSVEPSWDFVRWAARNSDISTSLALRLLDRKLHPGLIAAVHEVLVDVGGSYAELTSPSSMSVLFKHDPPSESLLHYLNQEGVVTSWRTDNGELRVFLRRP